MTFTEAISKVFSNYVTFTGRASRPEFWWWVLFTILGGVVTSLFDTILGFGMVDYGPINGLFSLGTVLPSIAVGVRRLHDIGKSGWWYLIILLPLIGILVLIYFWAQRTQAGQNPFGDQPPEAEGFTA